MTKHRYFGDQNIFKGALDEIIIRKELVILFLGSIFLCWTAANNRA